MALGVEYVIAITLASILLVLVVVLCLAFVVFLKRKRILCFKRDGRGVDKHFARSDQQLEAAYGLARGRKPKGKNISPLKRKEKHSHQYQRLDGRPPSASPRDPFANDVLENPLVHEEELDADWSNPAFDTGRSQLYDAAITLQSWYRMRRQRIPFVQLRQSVVVIQAVYKGWRVRKMLPQLKREKQQRDQQRKKQASWKRKGTLAALKFYDVKGYGFAEVEQLYGLETIRNAADQLKKLYGGKGKMRLKLFISTKGIKLFDYYTMEHFATVKIPSVSFCSVDPKNKRIFAFINRKKRRCFCHIFQASEQDAQKMVETTSEAFDVTFRRMERRRADRDEQKRMHIREVQAPEERDSVRMTQLRKAFHHHSQELDVEVASMLEMAENPPTANTHPHQEVHTVEVLPGQPATARGGARRDSPPPVSRNIPSRRRAPATAAAESAHSPSGSGTSLPGPTDQPIRSGRSRSSASSSGSTGQLLPRKASPRTQEGQPREHLGTKHTAIGAELKNGNSHNSRL